MRGMFHEESNRASDGIKKRSHGGLDGKLVWPSTKFNSFVLEKLTKKPIRPISLASLINEFKNETNSNLTIQDGKNLLVKFYAYIKDSRIFFLKHKSVPTFTLTCCSFNLYSIVEGNTKIISR